MLTGLFGIRFSRSNTRRAGFVLTAALIFPGCATWDQPAASDTLPEESRTMSSMRTAGPEGQMTGIDERARQIERNLGLR